MVILPVVVDLPESTWPITTTLMCIFSLLDGEEELASSPSESTLPERGVMKRRVRKNVPHNGGIVYFEFGCRLCDVRSLRG